MLGTAVRATGFFLFRGLMLSGVVLIVITQAPHVASLPQTERVSVSSSGEEAQGPGDFSDWSYSPSISRDGRSIAFESWAYNLVPHDDNFYPDIFVHDLASGDTVRVSVSSSGRVPNGASTYPSISDSGRFVTFQSDATNLVPHDRNGETDIFLRDRDPDRDGLFDEKGGTSTVLVSVSSNERQGKGPSSGPLISPNGRYLVFESDASNLAPRDTNHAADVFVRDLRKGVTRRLSVSSAGRQANSGSGPIGISGDGRFVSFGSSASNLVPDDTNQQSDVFVRDRDPDRDGIFDEPREVRTFRISVSSTNHQANGSSGGSSVWNSLSFNGRYATFVSDADNLGARDFDKTDDVFVRDIRQGRTWLISVGPGGKQVRFADGGSISARGRFVAFFSLIDGDVYVRDRKRHQTFKVSVAYTGGDADGPSYDGVVARSGRAVAFASEASNLVVNDQNAAEDVFVRTGIEDLDAPLSAHA